MTRSKFKPTAVTKQVVNGGKSAERSKYDHIVTTQQAINMAIAEHRVVRFQTDKSNEEIKRTVDDLRGCVMRKPDKDAKEVAIIPPGIEDFCFEEEIDTSLIVVSKPKIWMPGDR